MFSRTEKNVRLDLGESSISNVFPSFKGTQNFNLAKIIENYCAKIEKLPLETKSIIPGKLFEYMVSERPIIAIGPKDSDFADIITSTNTGVFFTYDEKQHLKRTIMSYFELYLEKKLHVHPIGLQQYSRKSLTEKLSKLITHNS